MSLFYLIFHHLYIMSVCLVLFRFHLCVDGFLSLVHLPDSLYFSLLTFRQCLITHRNGLNISKCSKPILWPVKSIFPLKHSMRSIYFYFELTHFILYSFYSSCSARQCQAPKIRQIGIKMFCFFVVVVVIILFTVASVTASWITTVYISIEQYRYEHQ